MLDEVELTMEMLENEVNSEPIVELDSGKSNIVAYGVFSGDVVNDAPNIRYAEFSRITGKGVNLYFDKNAKEYILERDNYEDSIGDSFTRANYVIDINLNKAPGATYVITDVSADISPNTLKQGYLTFKLTDVLKNSTGIYKRENGRIAIIVRKIL
jgi:hypothetical protein